MPGTHCTSKKQIERWYICILEPRDHFETTERVALAKATKGKISSVRVSFNLFSKDILRNWDGWYCSSNCWMVINFLLLWASHIDLIRTKPQAYVYFQLPKGPGGNCLTHWLIRLCLRKLTETKIQDLIRTGLFFSMPFSLWYAWLWCFF